MQARVMRYAVCLGAGMGLAGCAFPTPGPADYGAASASHEQRAQEHAYSAQKDQAAANWAAANGNYAGASQAQAAAQGQANAARAQRFQANKDSWLSRL